MRGAWLRFWQGAGTLSRTLQRVEFCFAGFQFLGWPGPTAGRRGLGPGLQRYIPDVLVTPTVPALDAVCGVVPGAIPGAIPGDQ